jgi:cell wall-associated protease
MSGPRSVTASFTQYPTNINDCGCPMECLDRFSGLTELRAIPRLTRSQQAPVGNPIDLTLLRTFRDQVLARSSQGQGIIDIFYKFSAEITFHFATSSDLRTISVQAILNLQPLLRDMVAGTGELTMSSNQVNAVNALVAKLQEVAGVNLKSALQVYRDQAGALENLVGKTSAGRVFLGIQLQIVN